MSPNRRAILGSAAGLALGSVAGCSALSPAPPSGSAPSGPTLAGETVFLADDVTLPEIEGERSEAPTNATVAVYPVGVPNRVATALASGTPAVVVGERAPLTLRAACDELDASYGFCSDNWNASVQVAGAVPRSDRLDTHVFVGPTLPRDLPWALGETLDPPYPACDVPFDFVEVPDDGVFAGMARIRGHAAVGGFDRRDSVIYRHGDGATAVYVDTDATIWSGEAAAGDERYNADRVALSAAFDADLDEVGPGAYATDGLRVLDRTDPTREAAEQAYTALSDETRDGFTACSRCRVVTDELGDAFGYTANARFRWRDPRLLGDDGTWNQHTPGRAVWSL